MTFKQRLIDLYNSLESWVTCIVGVIYGFWFNSLWQRIYSLNQQSEEVNYNFKDNLYEIISFIVLLLACIIICYYLKKSKTSNEIKLESQLSLENNKNLELNKELGELKAQLEEAQTAIADIRAENIEELFNISSQFLRFLVNGLGFNHQDRISLYIHNEQKGYFTLLARYSSNPGFCKKHRKTFPDKQGILGFTWHRQRNFHEIYDFPHTFKQFQKKCLSVEIPEKVAKELTMKSTEYISIPVSNNGSNVGVILIESIRKQKKDDNETFLKKEKNNIILMIENHNMYLVELINQFHYFQRLITPNNENEEEV